MARARFAAAHACGLLLVALCLLWLSRDGALDLRLAGWFAAPDGTGFPLRDEFVFAHIGHTGLRWLALALWVAALALAVASAKAVTWHDWRGPLWFFCITVAATTTAVLLLKRASPHSCPWDLVLFGGHADWFPLLSDLHTAEVPGRCWPSGHAAAGFSMIAGYFALRDRRPALARIALALGLGLGSAMSVVQMARGAHLLSHNLWSLWIAWLFSVVGYLAWRHRGS